SRRRFQTYSVVKPFASLSSREKAILIVLTWMVLASNMICGRELRGSLSNVAAKVSAPQGTAARIRQIIASGRLPVLRWPDFSDYKIHLESFYESSEYSPAWIRESQATAQA